MEELLFKGRKRDDATLIEFGFKFKDGFFVYTTPLVNEQFDLFVTINAESEVSTKLIDKETSEAYVLHLRSGSKGTYVAQVKKEYEEVLKVIDHLCFDQSVYKSHDVNILIEYIKEHYQDELEFPWSRSSRNGIVRHEENNKWYAAFLIVKKQALGIEGEGRVEVMNIKVKTDLIETIIDHEDIFPAYHMNKKHWVSIVLGHQENLNRAIELLNESYDATL